MFSSSSRSIPGLQCRAVRDFERDVVHACVALLEVLALVSLVMVQTNEQAGGRDLPGSAVTLANDAGCRRYLGPATPPGNGPDRYFLVVHAVDAEELELSAASTPAYMDLLLFSHAIARASIHGIFERA
jgi:phosphatidylethanolamine-binding protein (PEBP) family uncharacterized protein